MKVIENPEIPGVKKALILEHCPGYPELAEFDHWIFESEVFPWVYLGRIALTEERLIMPTNHPAILIAVGAPESIETLVRIKITDEKEVY